ncbi:mitochondrial-processing peptidase subunit alpha-like isoform X2 [Eriocheir sinensis]|uniref:mitochondrial-processing peptidase subunit alpha-like isoform X2 n=1 Tax=Eriocheir sinensis TaxID=95602 RepID=UPI0021C87223|nr:mitochondrial-processing peptidase subunit alpha-like isoform X2 [Eriocheir sinensis]
MPRQGSNVLVRFCSGGEAGSQGKAPITKIPLSESVSWLPKPVYASPADIDHETRVTTLENGLRVASEPKFGNFCTVGVAIDSGSRFEVAFPSGISHFLEKLAYRNSQNMTREKIMGTFEKLGGICDCQSSRDTLIYATSVEARGMPEAVKILSEVILRPKLEQEEITDARMAVTFDLEDLQLRPEKDVLLTEMIHAAAFRDNTLGLPKICPLENITKIDRSTLFTYLKHHHTPKRMVLAGVGVEHDALVEYAQKYFVEIPPIWETDQSLVNVHRIAVDQSVAQYTGGLVKEEADLSDVSIGPNPLPELAHLVIGLESVGHQHKDFVSHCVLNMMMGGGGSFSAGGPGKGMYTRLYTNVLNRFHWIHNATAYNHSYEDAGLFCIHASAHPSHLGDLTQIITRELTAMNGRMSKEELERAKVQLQSMLLMNLESRPVVFEDIARQVLATGKRLQPQHFIDLIKKVTDDDIMKIAGKMLRSRPSVAALGTLKRLPRLPDINGALLSGNGTISSLRIISGQPKCVVPHATLVDLVLFLRGTLATGLIIKYSK